MNFKAAMDSLQEAAIASERERCAKIADAMFERYQHLHLESLMKKDGLHEAWSIGMASASKIATAIREANSRGDGR